MEEDDYNKYKRKNVKPKKKEVDSHDVKNFKNSHKVQQQSMKIFNLIIL